ncbi:TIR domain-containing protein [Streptomyces sp. 2323.1]|uniref:TIR domain-containing protein n=1 Tax=Streptomyces sp. 2323.1 TaxID=1938841 RepID=UPI0026B4479F
MAAAAESVFVSYAGPDRTWAEWAAWHLREAGHSVELDVWDWRTGDNFVERMADAMRRATTVVALFSNNYFDPTRWTREEWTSIVGRRERLVPVAVEPLTAADVPDVLTAVIRKDLHGLDEPSAIAALLNAVNGPTSPRTAPTFPGALAPAPATSTDSNSQRPRLPSGASVPQVWRVGPRNPHFTGRESLLAQIREDLLGGRRAVALHGLGGIGKTQIALEYAHRFASQYDAVWWIDAEQADQILVRYTELAARLGIAKPDAGAEHNARSLLEHLRAQERWLIILDNASDPQDFVSLIPTGPGHVLITSRDPGWKDRVHSLNLGVFTRSDSVAYLTARIPGITPQQAGSLADDLGDLPLALAQAAGVVTGGMTVGRYRLLLTDKTAKLMANGSPPGYPAPLLPQWTSPPTAWPPSTRAPRSCSASEPSLAPTPSPSVGWKLSAISWPPLQSTRTTSCGRRPPSSHWPVTVSPALTTKRSRSIGSPKPSSAPGPARPTPPRRRTMSRRS